MTRRELDLRTNRLARAYQLKGVKRNDFVTVALPNSIEFYEACVAIWKLGAIPQPVSYRLPEIELSAVVELANPSLIVGVGLGSFHDRQILHAGFQADPQLSDEPLPDAVALLLESAHFRRKHRTTQADCFRRPGGGRPGATTLLLLLTVI